MDRNTIVLPTSSHSGEGAPVSPAIEGMCMSEHARSVGEDYQYLMQPSGMLCEWAVRPQNCEGGSSVYPSNGSEPFPGQGFLYFKTEERDTRGNQEANEHPDKSTSNPVTTFLPTRTTSYSAGSSCNGCGRRKRRCSKTVPCEICTRSGEDCIYEPYKTRGRKHPWGTEFRRGAEPSRVGSGWSTDENGEERRYGREMAGELSPPFPWPLTGVRTFGPMRCRRLLSYESRG